MSRKIIEGKDPSRGKGSFANMPQESMQEYYPRQLGKNVGSLDDTMSGIDEAIGQGHSMRSKKLSHQK